MPRSAADAFAELNSEIEGGAANLASQGEISEEDRQRIRQMRKTQKPTKLKDMNPLDREQLEKERLMLQQGAVTEGERRVGQKKGGAISTSKISTASKNKNQCNW
jgi:hypothetical protein